MPTVFADDHDVEISQALADLGDEWTKLVLDRCGPPEIPVTIANRKRVGVFPDYQHEVNTALPLRVGGVVALVLALEDTNNIDEDIAAHELLHWIARLKGFRTYKNHTRRDDNCELMLNCLLSHPIVNREAERRGFSYVHLFDENARAQAGFLASPGSTDLSGSGVLRTAMYCSDLVLNCSDNVRSVLEVSMSGQPQVAAVFSRIMCAVEHYDLLDASENSRAGRKIIQVAGLARRGNYIPFDDAAELRSMLRLDSSL